MEKSVFTQEYAVLVELLRDYRLAAGITQAELADQLSQSQSFVSKFERGEIRLDLVQVRHICLTLGTDLAALVERFEVMLRRRSLRTSEHG